MKPYNGCNEDGSFKIRICQNCFSTFEAAPVCPYCGAEYITTREEIQNMKEVQLKKIEEAKEAKRQEYMDQINNKVSEYKTINECRTFAELVSYCKQNNKKIGYAYIIAKQRGIFIPRGGKK